MDTRQTDGRRSQGSRLELVDEFDAITQSQCFMRCTANSNGRLERAFSSKLGKLFAMSAKQSTARKKTLEVGLRYVDGRDAHEQEMTR